MRNQDRVRAVSAPSTGFVRRREGMEKYPALAIRGRN